MQKPDKISGRLLGVSRNGAEIEGHGTIPFSEDLQCYRLYDGFHRQTSEN
ncbi:MAG: hypothetical protein ACLURV_11265 [Gallintestinimicrobium sp.]